MVSLIKVDKLDPQSGTALEIGTSGDTITVPSGATLDISSATLTPPATLPASSGVNLTALNASNLGSGTVPTARLGTGTASSSTVLYGDQTYKAEPTGGKCLQVLEAGYTSATATTISAGSGSVLMELDMTVSASSKVLCWFISGETDRGDSDVNPKTIIRVDGSAISSSIGTNHWFYDGTSGESNFRIAISQSALSGSLSAGTRTIEVYCDAYGGAVTYNFQNGNAGRLQVMEIGA
jgi:hypothetical protein